MPEQSLSAVLATKHGEANIQRAIDGLSPDQAQALLYDWHFWGRPSQIWPDERSWHVWLMLAGRGWGKTRAGAEACREAIARGYKRLALVAPTAADARDVMVEGESGVLNCFPETQRPLYEPSKRRITFHNGSVATLFSADEPERLRGPQHDFAWCDEPASWRYPEAWDMLMLGLRLGDDPRAVVTGTPKPIKLIKELIAEPSTYTTVGTTYDNRLNLAPSFFDKIIRKYEGTRLGRQELLAQILDDIPGALWTWDMMDAARRPASEVPANMARVVVAIDPAVTSSDASDETGIVVAGIAADGTGWVLDDVSGTYSPDEWASKAVEAYRRWQADRVVAEVNNGGDLVERILRIKAPAIPYHAVRATRGKYLRAEPIAALYEQSLIRHLGRMEQLEEQMTTYTPEAKKSPDRLDALVWALSSLYTETSESMSAVEHYAETYQISPY